ncbi:ABC transporter permease [Clostridium botulinum]|uniref:ABC transporter permease n=1 Tax=Clostridium botulinum TaxID=1491 RepID=A0AAU8YX26_CLOBO|nr:FtsX-like permease family protein [Clostridium sporogenes]AVP63609.1 ABC transporter permease [Clostridium botulinum]MCF4016337.1 FtsX-like permease family protein [Clostridium sporogenes]NFG02616.1 FtsX-like permease family protein [Clostridium sporogenes]
MKFQNNNKAIIKKLTKNSIKANKIRNIFAIIAIAITTILFTSLFTIGMGMKNSIEQQTMRQVGGYAHGTFKYLTQNELEKLKKHPSIKEFGYSIMVNSAENKELLKHYTEIRYATDTEAKMFFSTPAKGKMPEKESEIATDTAVLDLLGVQHKIGERIKVEYYIDKEKFSKEFVLSGFWESDEAMPASMMFVSKEFIHKNIGDRINKSHNPGDYVGVTNLDVMFRNSRNLEEKMERVITESGFAPKSIATGVNWAYLSTNNDKDPSIIIAGVGALLLIIFTGYLIIYNIFQISVIKDIRFYGLLKTVGTTSKQIKKLIKNQALMLSFIGIPIGLILGYIIGNVLLPVIISTSTIKTSYISFSPIIFIGSAVFAIITVLISCTKPGKIAAKVSPIEATRYVDATVKLKKEKKSSNGGKIYNMAKYNMLRNKKKTILVIISISLSLIILNSVFTLIKGFSMDKYIGREVSSDFIAANANYFSMAKHFTTEDDVISEEMINNINKLDGIKGEGRIYYNVESNSIIFNGKKSRLQLYGMDDFPLSKLNVVEGKIDLEKFKTGKYIIENLGSDDNGRIRTEESKCKIGDKVTIKLENNVVKQYEVMAKAELKYKMSVRYSGKDEPQMCISSSEFKKEIKQPLIMSYVFDIDDKYEDKIEKFLNDYTKTIEPQMNYESKQKYKDDFKGMQNMILLVGGVTSLIIGVIGILNFINAMLTSIISRKREFAMLQSIGMTNKQLNKMLILEGVFYAVGSIVISIILGSIASLTIVKTIGNSLWFFEYKFILTPILSISPILVLISILVPFVIYVSVNKQTIVERLRETE